MSKSTPAPSQQGISRRSFLTGAALVGATAAAAGLTGCAGAPAKDAAPDDALAATGAAADVSPNGAQFAIAPVSVAEAGEPVRECDYLVIGGGNCGMMSAARGSALGLSTILLEKAEVTGGSSVGTEVTMAFSDCKIMQEFQDDPNVVNVSRPSGTPNEIFTYFMMHNGWQANADLVSNYVHHNHRMHDFLYENGAKPMMLLPALDSPTCGIMYEDQAIGAHKIMQATAEKNGAEILTGAPATALVVDENGAVVGAMADIDGASGYVKAKAVFVGTGGFATNEKMVEAFMPGYGPMACKRDEHLAHDGDGIAMLLGVGGVLSDVGYAHPSAASVEGVVWDTPIDKAAREPHLWVNALGARLGNEKWSVMDTMFKVGVKEAGHVYFNVIDTAAARRMQTEDFLTSCRTVLGSPAPEPHMIEELEAGVEAGTVYKGDTIADLAAAAGIDAEGLQRTLDAYNEMARAGEDTQFFKDPAALMALEEGPFYAFKLIPSWYSTLCGVKVNGNIEVIDSEGRAIDGIYAGGLDSGEFFKDHYNHGFSGSCSGYSYFTGFYAADQAKAYIDSL